MALSMSPCIIGVNFLRDTQFRRHHTNARLSADRPKGITQMHHFRFSADRPGVVFVKNTSNDLKERKINLLKSTTWRPTPTNLPERIIPMGLSLERQWYLYQKIHDFCPDNVQDTVCPQPSTPLS